MEADWLKYSQLADKTRFFDKLQENFLSWTVSLVAVPVGASWMTATLLYFWHDIDVIPMARVHVRRYSNNMQAGEICQAYG